MCCTDQTSKLNPVENQKKRCAEIEETWRQMMVEWRERKKNSDRQRSSSENLLTFQPGSFTPAARDSQIESLIEPRTATAPRLRFPSQSTASSTVSTVSTANGPCSVEASAESDPLRVDCFDELLQLFDARAAVERDVHYKVLVTGSLYLVGAALRVLTRPDLGRDTLC